jgi:sigma-E factor negative regulatory protein RseC
VRQNGIVTRVLDDSIVVSLGGGTDCSSCGNRNSCFSLTGSRMRKMEATLDNTVGASVGDLVQVELLPRASMAIITISFLLPVALLLAGYAVAMPMGPYQGAAGAGIGLMVGIVLSIILNRKIARKKNFDLRITGIVDNPECPPGNGANR